MAQKITNKQSSNWQHTTSIASALLLAVLLGYGVGRLVDSKASQADAVLHLVQDTRSPVPTVHIHGIENGMIQGSITGVARVFFGDELAVSDASGSFLLPADILTVNEITVPVPEGMLYVASKQGEKYYSVESSGGARIKPENRVYFPDKESAVKAGFRP